MGTAAVAQQHTNRSSGGSGLALALENLLAETSGEKVSLGDLVAVIGQRGFGVVMMLLALPSALPVPAAGYSTPPGVLIMLLALQMMAGRQSVWLPEWAGRLSLKRGLVEKMVKGLGTFLRWTSWLVRPRLEWLTRTGGRRMAGLVLLLVAFIMALPIPMTNTFPAMVIFVISVGLAENDGLFTLGACILGGLTVLMYAVVLYIFCVFIFLHHGSVGQFREWFMELIRFS